MSVQMRTLDTRTPDAVMVLDLDGTILDDGLTMSELMVGALERLAAQGARLVVATGRTPAQFAALDLPPAVRRLIEPHVLLADGDLWWLHDTATVVRAQFVPAKAVEIALAECPHVAFMTPTGFVATSRQAGARIALRNRDSGGLQIASGLDPDGVLRIYLFDSDPRLPAAFAACPGIQLRPEPQRALLEVKPTGSCKAAAVHHLTREVFGQPGLDGVAACGDGLNDACLLGAVSLGVAAQQAHPTAVQRAAVALSAPLHQYLARLEIADIWSAPPRELPCHHFDHWHSEVISA
jgi:phosphoserine phosphatase